MSQTIANVTCVALQGRAMLITGPPGSGKSGLALALLDRGAELIGDDGVTLEEVEGRIVAAPPPNTRGLLEIRNVGLMKMPTVRAPVTIVINLSADAERLPPSPQTTMLMGHEFPQVDLWPDTPFLALRAEAALKMHGLD